MEHFSKYLYGHEFHLRTDHSALTWVGFSVCRNIISLPSTVKAGSTTMPMPFHDDPVKRGATTAKRSRHEQTSKKYEPLRP
jgi:hypothetical protein